METAKQNLQLIEEMIATAKGNLAEGSIFYLIWGWLVFIAASINYYLLNYTDYENHWIAWPFLMILGGILSSIVGYRRSKTQTVKTYIDRFMAFLWLSFLITLIVVLYGISILGEEAIYPIILALYGLGTFASGGILKYKPLMVGGIGAWVCSIIAFHVGFSDQLLLVIAAILVSYIIPGHLLKARGN